MRVLCLHPEDDPLHGPWLNQKWDQIFDLGVAGDETYAGWSSALRCAVEPLPKFEIRDFAGVRHALSSGLGRILDGHGLDWWELISIRFHEQIALTIRLRKLAAQVAAGSDVFVTRSGLHAEILRLILGRSVATFSGADSAIKPVFRGLASFARFGLRQCLHFGADKYDAGYQVRRFLSWRVASSKNDAVLLPVANRNATRTALGYAGVLPERHFLLMATREDACVNELPPNVERAKLASYGAGNPNRSELQALLVSWQAAQEFSAGENQEIAIVSRLVSFASIARMLRHGLSIRNAWLRVFENCSLSAVLCTDDTNPNTYIPLLLARSTELPTVVAHHGALDGSHLFKKTQADLVLAKGEMERDYLVRACGVPEGRVDIGAYASPPTTSRRAGGKKSVLFFSEPYLLDYGRCREIYQEVLPRLADLAFSRGLELVLKLHPMESAHERRSIVDSILSAPQRHMVRLAEGSLSEELLESAEFALTIQSTTTVDCALRRIPIFLCAWLDYSYYGYVQQFINFRAGIPLYSAAEIASIPSLLNDYPTVNTADLWQSVSAHKLRQLLTMRRKMAVAV